MNEFVMYFYNKANEFLTANGIDTLGTGVEADSYNQDNDKAFEGTEGNDTLLNGEFITGGGSNVTIYGHGGNDYIQNISDYVTIDGGSGNNLISNVGKYSYVSLGSGNDYIVSTNTPEYATLDAGDGDNIIYSSYQKVSILSGSGNDLIWNVGGNNASIKTGLGNDSIGLSSTSVTSFYYNLGDGNDSIWGYTTADTLNISGASYSAATVDNNVVITVGEGTDSVGTITLINAAGTALNITSDGGTTESTTGGETTETSTSAIGATDYVFIFDTSGSMSTYINRVKDIAADFTSQLTNAGVDYRLGIVEYEDTDSIATYEFTTDLGIFTANVATVAEKTSGADEYGLTAIETALTMDFRENANKRFILLTDEGYEENNYGSTSSLDSTTVIADLNNNSVILDVIGEKDGSYYYSNSCENEWTPVAQATGGDFYDINGDYNLIFREIATGKSNAEPHMQMSRWSYNFEFPSDDGSANLVFAAS